MVIAINQCGIPVGYAIGGIVIPLMLTAMHWQTAMAVLGLALIGYSAYQNQRDQARAHSEAQIRAIGEFRIEQISSGTLLNQVYRPDVKCE